MSLAQVSVNKNWPFNYWRIVDVGTGDCLSWIRCSWTRYDSLRFNSKYIVAMEKRTKTMVIFDFPSALDPRKDLDKVTLCSFQWPAEGVRKLRNFHMDEFQMVGAGFNTGDRAASFYVLDFFEKVIQRWRFHAPKKKLQAFVSKFCWLFFSLHCAIIS